MASNSPTKVDLCSLDQRNPYKIGAVLLTTIRSSKLDWLALLSTALLSVRCFIYRVYVSKRWVGGRSSCGKLVHLQVGVLELRHSTCLLESWVIAALVFIFRLDGVSVSIRYGQFPVSWAPRRQHYADVRSEDKAAPRGSPHA
ncbi:hypothetical protein FOZ60_000256 [Perkinsus olseni]|uniref:Uncharacterized protein n=1 Tax=Perkinsus olseni TaxID=32597 RepID=A0A7J6P3G6_PEROL|nr:hypothetical protein FOZ60_000256 [Perkinsus olseni]